jgi:hypothetical protein
MTIGAPAGTYFIPAQYQTVCLVEKSISKNFLAISVKQQ